MNRSKLNNKYKNDYKLRAKKKSYSCLTTIVVYYSRVQTSQKYSKTRIII